MIEKLKKQVRVLLELETGIILVGMIGSILLAFLVEDKVSIVLGFVIGVVMAVLMAWHMWHSLDVALDLGEEDAVKKVRNNYLLRYTIVVFVLAIVMITEIANPISAFFGILSLKVAAYLQPFTHKFYNKIFREEDPIPQPMVEESEGVEQQLEK